jgi:hypothetical protein
MPLGDKRNRVFVKEKPIQRIELGIHRNLPIGIPLLESLYARDMSLLMGAGESGGGRSGGGLEG